MKMKRQQKIRKKTIKTKKKKNWNIKSIRKRVSNVPEFAAYFQLLYLKLSKRLLSWGTLLDFGEESLDREELHSLKWIAFAYHYQWLYYQLLEVPLRRLDCNYDWKEIRKVIYEIQVFYETT